MSFSKNRLEEDVRTAGLAHVQQKIYLPTNYPDIAATKLLINGKLVDSSNGDRFETFNPTTEVIITDVPRASTNDVETAILAAKTAYNETSWPMLLQSHRGYHLYKLAQLVEEKQKLFMHLGLIDSGKTSVNIANDIRHCIGTLHTFAHSHGQHHQKLSYVAEDGEQMATSYFRDSCGVIAAIITSHNPLTSLAQVISPALAYGNTVVILIDEEAPLMALQFAALLHQAGFPSGSINILTGTGKVRNTHLAIHRDINKVFLNLIPSIYFITICIQTNQLMDY